MHPDHQMFIQGIHSKKKLRLTFFSQEDRTHLVRMCAPMDFGPSRRANNKSDRYHFWNYESDTRNHSLSLLPEQINEIKLTGKYFEPVEFITWDVNKSRWFLPRNWGRFS